VEQTLEREGYFEINSFIISYQERWREKCDVLMLSSTSKIELVLMKNKFF